MTDERELFGQPAAPGRGAGAAYQVLARRARPQTFADVVGQEHVTQTLTNALTTGRLAHAFVFSGMRGVGKTTTARILAKALNCVEGPTAQPCNRCPSCVEITEGRSLDVLEVDAASQTGIDATRELLETVKYQPASGRFRVYIIDEAHGLSKQAVDAFLKTLEEPPPHAKFILATTAVHKLPTTILSRCQRFDFRSVAADTVVRTLDAMVRSEGMQADEEALRAIAREAGGSLRDATSLLDQVLAFSAGTVDAAAVNAALGLPDERAVRELAGAVIARKPGEALEAVARVCAQGVDMARFGQAILERIRNLTVLAVAGRQSLADLAPAEVDELEAAQRGVPAADLQRWFQVLLDGLEEISKSPYPRLVLEMAVVHMATLAPLVPLDELVARLEALEHGGGDDGRGGGRPQRGATPPGRSTASAPAARAPVATPAPPAATGAGSAGARGPGAQVAGQPAAPSPVPDPPPNGNGAGGGGGGASPEQARWKSLVDALQRASASRFFRLSYSKVVELRGDVLRVAVTGKEAINALTAPDVRSQIEDAIEREFGRRLTFDPVVPGDGSVPSPTANHAALDRQAREDPVVQLSVEILEGRVEGVLPRNRRED
ncbi:MAG: DNA polymerase III subunit gamma/tau [Thermodesulfobacteriota bacterium]